MEVIKINKISDKKNIYESEKKKNVCAYVRVSSNEGNGPISFNSQEIYYANKIKSNPNWNFVGVYSDEGISGANVRQRKGFKKMLIAAERGEIDLILTKSISRFSRNTYDSLYYIRLLKELNVEIMFEEEHISTNTMDGELVITILSSIAQQEIENLSKHVKHSVHHNMKQGKITKTYECYGYKFNDKTRNLYVDKKEAKMVKQVFDWYLEYESIGKVTRLLKEHKYKTKNGKYTWGVTTINEMLHNIKYTGDIILGNYYVNNPIDKKTYDNHGEENKYLIRNHHEAIIDKETFEKVQKLLDKHSKENKFCNSDKYRNVNLFTGLLKCGYCGSHLCKRTQKETKIYYYVCRNKDVKDENYCYEAKYIRDDLVEDVVNDMIKKLKNFKCNLVSFNYIKKTLSLKNIEKINREYATALIELILTGTKDDPFHISIILKNNNILEKVFKRENIDVSKYTKLFDFFHEFRFNYYKKGETRPSVAEGVNVSIYLDEAIE